MIDSHSTIPLLPKRKPRTKVLGVTPAELAVLQALDRAIRTYANPSLREIADCSDKIKSVSVIHKYLHRLAGKGYVKIHGGQARGVQLVRGVPVEAA